MPPKVLPSLLIASVAVVISGAAHAQQPMPTADQDRAEAERSHFVYVQHVRALSRKGKTVRCEEITDARVTPSDKGSHQELLKLDGRLFVRGKYVTYSTLPDPKEKAVDASPDNKDENLHANIRSEDDNEKMDRDLIENLRHNLLDADSKDGVAAGLFPLTSKAAPHYIYRLLGRELRNGRDAFHISFTPKDDEYDWKGDAWIDTTAYEPIVVRTKLDKDIPFAVRLLLGTSLPGLGFTVIYAPQPTNTPDALWFPSSFGTEFKMNILFFLHRTIVLDAQNREFEKTHVKSTILPSPESTQRQ